MERPILSEIKIMIHTKLKMTDLVSLVKVRLGCEKAETLRQELQCLLQYAAREGYEGRPLYLGTPKHIDGSKLMIMNIVGQFADKGSFIWVEAESLCNKLINEGYEHGENCRRFDDLAGKPHSEQVPNGRHTAPAV